MKEIIRLKIQLILWLGSVLIVILIGLYYIPREYNNISISETLYCILRLFVFERDLAEFPKSWPLIFIYFFAPLITVSAISLVISYIFRTSPFLRMLMISDHVIICGVGRTGKLIASSLREKGIKVIGIDKGTHEDFVDWAGRQKILMLYGNFRCKQLLNKAKITRARSVIFASGNDLSNIESAFYAYEIMKQNYGNIRIIWAHIADDRFAQSLNDAISNEGKVGIRIFDSYHIAAFNMMKRYMNENILNSVNEFNIIGYGKFGSDLLDVLVERISHKKKYKIQIIDKCNRANEVNRIFMDTNTAQNIKFICKDINDIEVSKKKRSVYFLCTDDDLRNLSTALILSEQSDNIHIFVRMSEWPMTSIKEHIGDDRQIIFVNINELINDGIKELPGIFSPALISDLKKI